MVQKKLSEICGLMIMIRDESTLKHIKKSISTITKKIYNSEIKVEFMIEGN